MNFFGLLWVISAVSSFFSPHESPRPLEHLSRTLSNRSIALISRVVGSRFPNHSFSSADSTDSTRPPTSINGLSESPAKPFSALPAPVARKASDWLVESPGRGNPWFQVSPEGSYSPFRRIVVPSFLSWNRSSLSIPPSIAVFQPSWVVQRVISQSGSGLHPRFHPSPILYPGQLSEMIAHLALLGSVGRQLHWVHLGWVHLS
ncbi:hypothetical protein [Egbenema bharatensis]|uniref:hypothetical protein n=1 Tax=Egbenema bharatensis TaxID=3463334 RepID=UPI003A8C6D15